MTTPAQKTIYERMFTGEIPVHAVYEDAENGFMAFLDIKPATEGHTIVIPREPIDKVYELPAIRSVQLSRLTQIISQRLQERLQPLRVTEHVYGFQIPHAHRMLVPSYVRGDVAFLNTQARMEQEPDHERLSEIAGNLRFTQQETADTQAHLRWLSSLITDTT